MNSVFCVFRTDSDGCTYSCEVLIGVFLTHNDANVALLKHIDNENRIDTIQKEYHACLRKNLEDYNIHKIITHEEYIKNRDSIGLKYDNLLGSKYGKSTNIEEYQIVEVIIGEIK